MSTAAARLLLVGLACLAATGCFGRGQGPEPSSDPLEGATPGAAGRPLPLVWVSVPGLEASWLAAESGSDALPTLRRLAREGVFATRVDPVSPPSTYPTHASWMTGTRPREHGIPADHRLGKRGVRRERYWHTSQLRGSALWQQAAQAGLGVASLDWPTTVGAELPDLLPDLRPTRRGQTWSQLLPGEATPWLASLVAESAGEAAARGGRDPLLVRAACELLERDVPPDLLLLRLADTEAFLLLPPQPDGDAAPRAEVLASLDAAVAELLGCLRAAKRLSTAGLVLTSDHPLVPVHTEIALNAELAAAGLVEVDARTGIEGWDALARSNGGSAFIYAIDAEPALRARSVVARVAAETRAFRVVPAEEMIRMGADPEAWFGVDAQPGYVFVDRARGPALRAAERRAAIGGLQREGTASAVFVAAGRGFRRGITLPVLRTEDIGPTVAEALGIPLPEARGRSVIGALVGGSRPARSRPDEEGGF